MRLRRGDLVTASFPGDIKKPRPAIVMQADEYIETHRTLLLCPLTSFRSEARLFRPVFLPTPENGLEHRSEAMIDKLGPVRKDGIRQRIGSASHEEMLQLELALITIAGLDRYLIFDEPSHEDQ
jgi:mRNA interferase MazF